MKILKSISNIYKVFPTGRKPVLLTCDDLNDYVCKHKDIASDKILFNEYFAASFLKLWKIKVPDFAFIQVNKKHIPEKYLGAGLRYDFFDKTCFGSFYLKHSKELSTHDSFFSGKKIDRFKKFDFLTIALFDIWIANEDRHHPGHNLLINFEKEGWFFYPIDHEFILNSNSGQKLVPITEEETLLAHDIFKILFKKSKIDNDLSLHKLFENFKRNVDICFKEFDNVIKDLPDDWSFDIAFFDYLKENLFDEEWINESINTFKYYFDKYLVK